jgi:metal-dependent amidase/aminoacylase/carboxypeptidase family protein
MPDDTAAGLQAWQAELTAIRRDIHAHPEMGLQEVRTAALVAAKLREWGISVTEGIGRTGVVVDADAPALHTPKYDFNDDIIPLGAAWWLSIVREELGLGSPRP